MPSFVSTKGRVDLNAVDLSADIKTFTFEDTRDLKPASAHGDLGIRRKAGLADWKLTIEAFSNEAASRINANLWALRGTEFAVKVRQDNGAISATNPEYRGNGMIESLGAVSGNHGEMAMSPIVIVGSDGVPATRNVT